MIGENDILKNTISDSGERAVAVSLEDIHYLLNNAFFFLCKVQGEKKSHSL